VLYHDSFLPLSIRHRKSSPKNSIAAISLHLRKNPGIGLSCALGTEPWEAGVFGNKIGLGDRCDLPNGTGGCNSACGSSGVVAYIP
jgi:hypothetical protein